MRSLLEQAIVKLLNDEQEQAQQIFHRYMVEKARQIHESLRESEDADVEECWDDDKKKMSEAYFTEDDLTDLEDDKDEAAEDEAEVDAAADDLADDMDVADEADADGEDKADRMDAIEDETAEIEDQLDDLEDQLEKLTAEFEALMRDENGDADMADEAPEADLDADEAADMAAGIEDDMSDKVKESEDDEDYFKGLSESITQELEKISIAMTADGQGVGTGSTFKVDGVTHSPVPDERTVPTAVSTKPSKNHTDFDLEPAPKVEKPKAKRRNALDNANDTLKGVSKEGDKNAALNSDFAGMKQR